MGKSFISTFKYECELAFNDSNGNAVEIMSEMIKYIYVQHDYQNNLMPVIYMKLNLLPSVYNKMVPQQGKSKMYLKLQSIRQKGATSSVAKNVIYDEFDYYMTDDPNAFKKLDTIGEEKGIAYKTCFIGLLKTELQKQNKKKFEGIYKNTNTMSLIQSATSKMKMVIQPFKNNTNLSVFVCPTITTVAQFISYVNSKHKFYNGSYMYFMDFDRTYLRSNDGSYIDIHDGDFKYIAFDIRDITANESLSSGIVEDESQDAYIIYINGVDAKIIIDRITSELVGRIEEIETGTGDIVNIANIDTQNITNIISNENASYIVTGNDPKEASYMSTMVSENSDTLIVSKIDMDSRIFTPNKQYLLSNYEDNPKYCGVYYLVDKKETYLRTGTQMSCLVTLTLKKCANFK